jgi:hypothetical protein
MDLTQGDYSVKKVDLAPNCPCMQRISIARLRNVAKRLEFSLDGI